METFMPRMRMGIRIEYIVKLDQIIPEEALEPLKEIDTFINDPSGIKY